jgi:putative hydrolase of the HAD superfamily
MFPFDVILFDVGGVLLTNGWDHRERAAAMEWFHLDPETFEARNRATYDAWERGLTPVEAYLDETIFYEPRDFSRDDFFAFMLTLSQPLPDGALGVLKELAASDTYMLGALNNEPRETNEYRLKHFGLRHYIEVALSSCYLGMRKPERAIYRRALDILGRPPQRILFIDDRIENVAAAAASGMKVIWYENSDALRRELRSLDVL